MGRVLSSLDAVKIRYHCFDQLVMDHTVHELHPSGCRFWGRIALIDTFVPIVMEIMRCTNQRLRGYRFECRCYGTLSV
jgi:hypothetical protein